MIKKSNKIVLSKSRHQAYKILKQSVHEAMGCFKQKEFLKLTTILLPVAWKEICETNVLQQEVAYDVGANRFIFHLHLQEEDYCQLSMFVVSNDLMIPLVCIGQCELHVDDLDEMLSVMDLTETVFGVFQQAINLEGKGLYE